MLNTLTAESGIILLGCGKMGLAMLKGWLAAGLPGSAIEVVEPHPYEALCNLCDEHGIRLSTMVTRQQAAIVVIAVKPQILNTALPAIASLASPNTVVLSVAAGAAIAQFQQVFGPETPVIRTMPNTPAAIGHGITALIGSANMTETQAALAETMMQAVGEVVWLSSEKDMDAVTGVSGSGPAYVFHMVEALAAAGEKEGLDPALAMRLARATVSGAGALLAAAQTQSAAELREAVTSPKGTTHAGLQALMAPETGLTSLMTRTVAATTKRSRELGS